MCATVLGGGEGVSKKANKLRAYLMCGLLYITIKFHCLKDSLHFMQCCGVNYGPCLVM